MKMSRKGFTLVEIMIVVAIIGILAAIAIPNFLKSRNTSQMNACIANMKQIEGAIEQAKLAGNSAPTLVVAAAVTGPGIYGDLGYVKTIPTCPYNKGAYTLVADVPTCPNATAVTGYPHKLPDSAT